MNNNFIKKLLVALGTVGPGLFLIAYNIGTGSIITMAKAGADYGMSLFWTLVLSCIFTYVRLPGRTARSSTTAENIIVAINLAIN